MLCNISKKSIYDAFSLTNSEVPDSEKCTSPIRDLIISEQNKMEVTNKLRGMPTYLLKEVVAFLQQRMVLESHCTWTWPPSSLEC